MDLAVVAATHEWDFAWSSQFVSWREACEVQGFAVATPASQSAGCPARFHAALCSSFHYRSPPPGEDPKLKRAGLPIAAVLLPDQRRRSRRSERVCWLPAG